MESSRLRVPTFCLLLATTTAATWAADPLYPGAVDPSFTPGLGANGPIQALAVQPDGHILIGGSFTSFNNVSCDRIARLNPNGTFDSSFTASFPATVTGLALLKDGKVLV